MTTPSIPGIDRDALVAAITAITGSWSADLAADAALAYIADHHKCVCEHTDEWVRVDEDTWNGLPEGARLRLGWAQGDPTTAYQYFVHRDDLPDLGTTRLQRL